jgi:hemerythrin
MTLFEWKDMYSVNVAEIDNQHKLLVESLNGLYEAMLTRKAKEIIDGILKGLTDYAGVHFSYEERLMQMHGYPDYSEHKKKHEAFIKKVTDFTEKHKRGSLMVSMEVLNFLKEWLRDHILVIDKQYSTFFNEKGVH